MLDMLSWVHLLKTKQISHQELLKQWHAVIETKNFELNALVSYFPEEVTARYNQDRTLDTLPFAGLPVPLKILGHAKASWPQTSASRLLMANKARQTSFFVKRFEEIGFVPIGQTNAPEFGFKNITDPSVYGVTRNPWNVAYSAGGSSGGAAAAVASGMFPMATASDGGGSIRIPASFTGLIGLKPTRGVMPVGPGDMRSWQGASVSFALTRSMRDTEKLFYLLRDATNGAPYQAPLKEWQQTQAATKKRLKIALCMDSPIGSKVSDEAKQAVLKTARCLSENGHEITEVNYPIDGRRLIEAYYRMNGADTAAMFHEIEQGLKRPVTQDDMELMTWGIYQSGKKMYAADYVQSLQVWDEAGVVMETLFETYDLFLSPTATTTAPAIEQDLQSEAIRQALYKVEELSFSASEQLIYDMFEKSLAITPYTQLANLTGQPAISLPLGKSDNGLPIGVQFQAARGREDLLFQVGYELERAEQFEMLYPTEQIGENC